MKDRGRLIAWDAALLIGIAIILFVNVTEHYYIMIGFLTALILSNCVRNHIAAYKLNGKIY